MGTGCSPAISGVIRVAVNYGCVDRAQFFCRDTADNQARWFNAYFSVSRGTHRFDRDIVLFRATSTVAMFSPPLVFARGAPFCHVLLRQATGRDGGANGAAMSAQSIVDTW